MKRSVAVVVGIALAAGVALGAVAFSGSGTSSAAGQSASDLHTVWSGGTAGVKGDPGVYLESGSLQGEPGHGFVLVEVPGQKPAFYSGSAGTGAFHLVSKPRKFSSIWVFRAADGSLLLVTPGHGSAVGTNSSFVFLGKRLDPAKLGGIGARGVAVPVTWGPYLKDGRSEHTAVVLVEQLDHWPGWRLDGHLGGFSLPQGIPPQRALQRPLLGADGHLYSIDAKGQRLVRLSGRGSLKERLPKFGCASWPGPEGGSYRACPNSIVLRKADGSAVTLLQRQLPGGKAAVVDRGWYFVQASPNRKWLLLEDAFGACGVATWAEFQQGSGPLVSAFPDADSSQALGWLPDNTALVAVQTSGCDGAPAGGIYQVTPGNWVLSPQLVFPGEAEEATTWGFGR